MRDDCTINEPDERDETRQTRDETNIQQCHARSRNASFHSTPKPRVRTFVAYKRSGYSPESSVPLSPSCTVQPRDDVVGAHTCTSLRPASSYIPQCL